MNNTLGERVKTRRLQLGLSQVELAKRAKCTQGTIGNLEKEIRKQPRDLLRLAAALECSPDWLSTGRELKYPTEPPANPHRAEEAALAKWPFSTNLSPYHWELLSEKQKAAVESVAIAYLPINNTKQNPPEKEHANQLAA